MKRNKLHFLFFSLNYHPEIVGVGKYSGEFVKKLCDDGHEVSVICGTPHYPIGFDYGKHKNNFTKFKEANLQVLRVPVLFSKKSGGLFRILSQVLSTIFILYHLPSILSKRYDVTVLIAPSLINATIAIPIAFLRSQNFWLHFHDFEVEAAVELKILKKKSVITIARLFDRWVTKYADIVSCVSQTMLNRIRQLHPKSNNLILFRNWSDPCSLEKYLVTDRCKARIELGLPENKKILLYSGSLASKQGTDLFALMYELTKKDQNYFLVICSSGTGVLTLRRKLHLVHNVKFMELLPEEDFIKLMQVVDLHLLPQQDSLSAFLLPSKLNTMLLCGQPIVTNCCADSELGRIISDSGIFVGNNVNLNSVLEKINNALEERCEINLKSKRTFKKYFDKDKVLNEVMQDLDEVLRKNSR